MTKQNVIVCDLDGTLCDVSHRIQYAQMRMWDEFNAGLGGDKLITPIAQAIEALYNSGHYIIFLTGRSEKHRSETLAWLYKHNVSFHVLLMRPDGDYTKDADMKLRELEAFFGGTKECVLSKVLFALDDRDQVIEGFRNYGLSAWQVREGDY